MSRLEVDSAAEVLKEEREVFRPGRTCPRPDLVSFKKEYLSAAEEAAQEVLDCIHPTLDSEEERSDVTDHLRRLIKAHVFPYGSVPLKTYLPDGDIDLTVLGDPSAGESLPHDVFAVLRGEEQNENSEYQIRDTQIIDAEVKLVKCIVQNVVVDISFNQIGGLSTLCFLEQVDRLVGKNHLFKRSIILIKTWCFYESRILGSTHGLISTYALETLILYIFQLFHSTITGPLVALYMFLDCYSQFDWDNYCVSLKGPVRISSLPNIEVKMPDSVLNGLLLVEEFIENCVGMFSVSLKSLEANQKAFQPKHLNIIDPLKENNNLGRSVNRGNSFRIRSAIKYGARKLGLVLSLPSDQVADGIRKFFANALSRHRKQSRGKVEHLDLELGDEASLPASSLSGGDSSSIYDMLLESSSSDSDNDGFGVEGRTPSSRENQPDRCSDEEVSSSKTSESFCSANRASSVHGYNVGRTSSTLRSGASCYFSSRKLGASLHENAVKSPAETQRLEARKLHRKEFVDTAAQKSAHNSCSHPWSDLERTRSDSKAIALENLRDVLAKTDLGSVGGESEATDNLADLTGDYDSHLRSFLCGQLTTAPNLCSPSTSRIQNKNKWDPVEHSVPLGRGHHSQVNAPSFSMGQAMYSGADFVLPATGFHVEGRLNTRGTGTYFPTVVSGFYRDRPSQGRGRGRAAANRSHFQRYPHSNAASHPAPGRPGNRSHGQWESPSAVGDGDQSSAHLNSSCRIEFGSVGNLAEEVISASTQARGSTHCGLSGNSRPNYNK
ncbi:hypothetical protein F511_04843 [Dorcoceras hygrometricum]|uniref:PAP/OAS1 substrate-binding-related domain-containing protein n=1 Tax=Dorcoceras hygrometricum TaxID=472368 RepID=A0A2Z7B2N6_9LAMI|nr:hypothetical protein F511_04843 [Dorcoceras hygrometricum]